MVELLNTCYQSLISGSEVLVGWIISLLSWGGDLIVHLDASYPRTAGLVLGVALTWLMLRRDKHPFIRAVSAPLKLVIDVLDLAWDHSIEFIGDTLGVVWKWCLGLWRGLGSWIKRGWSWCIGCLENAKAKLTKARDSE